MAYSILYPRQTHLSSIIPTARRTVEVKLAEAAAPRSQVHHSHCRYNASAQVFRRSEVFRASVTSTSVSDRS
jgi:hypothetical protein